MTKKDYELIARIFNKNLNDTTLSARTDGATVHKTVKAIAMQFADVLKTTNQLFGRTRFLEACGVAE